MEIECFKASMACGCYNFSFGVRHSTALSVGLRNSERCDGAMRIGQVTRAKASFEDVAVRRSGLGKGNANALVVRALTRTASGLGLKSNRVVLLPRAA